MIILYIHRDTPIPIVLYVSNIAIQSATNKSNFIFFWKRPPYWWKYYNCKFAKYTLCSTINMNISYSIYILLEIGITDRNKLFQSLIIILKNILRGIKIMLNK